MGGPSDRSPVRWAESMQMAGAPQFLRVHSRPRRGKKARRGIPGSRENGESPLSSARTSPPPVVESKIGPARGCQWVARGLHNPCIIAAMHACHGGIRITGRHLDAGARRAWPRREARRRERRRESSHALGTLVDASRERRLDLIKFIRRPGAGNLCSDFSRIIRATLPTLECPTDLDRLR